MVSNPEVTATLASASVPIANVAQKILVVAQQHADATKTVDLLTEDIGANGEQVGYFGRRSVAAKVITAVKKSNPVSRIDAIGIGDGTTARVHTITVAASAALAGSFLFQAGSQKNHQYSIAVAAAESANDIATAMRAAVNADLDCPFLATGASADVILTAGIKGVTPNSYPIGIAGDVPGGVSFTLVETTPGAVDPDLSATLDVIGEDRYHIIVWCFEVTEGSTDDVVTELDTRFNTALIVNDGIALVQYTSTLTLIKAKCNAFNSENLIPIGHKLTQDAAAYFGPEIAEHPDELNGYFAGIMALRLTEDELITRFLTTSATGEQFGGPKGASLPLFNTPLKEVAGLVKPNRSFISTEITQLKDAGCGVFGNNKAETEVITGAIMTTYKTNAAGDPDPTWEFLNYRLTGAGIREYFHSNLTANYGQSRLTDGDLTPGAAVANEDSIREYCVRLFSVLSGKTFLLTKLGEDAVQYFKKNLVVDIDLVSGLATITALVPIVTQFRKINITLKVAFNTTGE